MILLTHVDNATSVSLLICLVANEVYSVQTQRVKLWFLTQKLSVQMKLMDNPININLERREIYNSILGECSRLEFSYDSLAPRCNFTFMLETWRIFLSDFRTDSACLEQIAAILD